MAQFFIRRPVFAIVIALLIVLAGALSVWQLPIEQFPPVAPPTVQVSTSYPGASASTVENTVVQVIEQQLNAMTAVHGQNVQVSGAQLGDTPATPHQQLTATITESTLMRTPEQFGAVLLKALPDGSQVRLRDVSRIALGAESFAVDDQYN